MTGLLTTLRMLLRYGLPLLGIVVVGRAIVLSIGGDIDESRFVLGIVLMALSFSARLVPKAGSAKRSSAKEPV